MFKKIGIILFFMVAVGAVREPPLQGLAFAQLQENGQPCPPECVTDSMEIITYYPSPYGYYEELRGDKIIVGDTDNSHIDETHLPPPGTITFEPLLDDPDASDGSLYEGSLYYQGAIGGTKGKFRFYDGSDWQDVGGGGGFFGAPQKVELASAVSYGPSGTITILSNTVTMPANGGPFRVLVSYAISGDSGGSNWALAWIEDNLGNKFAVKQDHNSSGPQRQSAVEISPVNYNSGQTVTFYLKGNSLPHLYTTDRNGVGLNPTWLMTQIIKTE